MSYIALATTTLSSAASSVTFSSIPTSVNGVALRDLIVIVGATAPSQNGVIVEFNSDTTVSNYTRVFMLGDGSAASSGSGNGNGMVDITTTQSANILQVMDYTATDKHKTVLSRSNLPSTFTYAMATRWANTSAINSVRLRLFATNFNSGSTFSLYGIAG